MRCRRAGKELFFKLRQSLQVQAVGFLVEVLHDLDVISTVEDLCQSILHQSPPRYPQNYPRGSPGLPGRLGYPLGLPGGPWPPRGRRLRDPNRSILQAKSFDLMHKLLQRAHGGDPWGPTGRPLQYHWGTPGYPRGTSVNPVGTPGGSI